MIIVAAMLTFVVSCGPQVELNYEKLETQYKDLTPYWEMCFDENLEKDRTKSIPFAVNYKKARDIINRYHSEQIAATPEETELLWNLRKVLQYASKYTNGMVLNQE